ncbi:MAG: hypothetical protein EBY21_13640 [Alphaproteobacteria bacterium]|nr:hypothetical protein [Alphaproteobacteria bacterium]
MLLLGLLAPLSCGSALAQSRPLSTSMTCNQARQLVANHGAVVMSTGPSLYDRYVGHQGFCTPTETIMPAYVPTKDQNQCMVGYLCVEVSREERRN